MPAETTTAGAAAAPPPHRSGDDGAEAFYAASLRLLTESGIPFLLGGTQAVNAYTGLRRRGKDLDVFCKAGDYPRILARFQGRGYDTEVEDERWIAKARKGPYFVDVIFNASTGLAPITDHWFAESHPARVYDTEVRIVAPTELVWSKMFVQDRRRYDGADVAHVILKQSERIDWTRLLASMEQYWEVLLGHALNFRFIYPTERGRVPRWLLDELTARLKEQGDLPVPRTRVCRGRLFSRDDYEVDVTEWGFSDP